VLPDFPADPNVDCEFLAKSDREMAKAFREMAAAHAEMAKEAAK